MPTVGCGRLAMPACVVGDGAGGRLMGKPPTEMEVGTPAAPFQLGALAVPVPGHAWQLLQSCELPVMAEWSQSG